MAFNFNWSPLTADSNFYSRAQELLTTALNKSPKPPIIVDDILVNELNLGSVPPDLEILEIGDLAEDRFRGIFKMCYTGDAFLTLKTRVQANPLNTYLFNKPSFASPQPLAAASGLTIPLQITLSEIKLSAFIILVFSKQKGITLVFRNDPLESLKVSSTFDSIPFVRDYLQKEIDGQLRVLLMEELPAIIHRLSLRLWVPEYRAKDDEELAQQSGKPSEEGKPINPLASPPQFPVGAAGPSVEPIDFSSLFLDSSTSESPSLFSQKNLLRLGALADSQRTLSLFTPSIRDAVFRAWAGSSERMDGPGSSTPATPLLSRTQSHRGSLSTLLSNESREKEPLPSRPSLVSMNSATAGLGLGASRHSRNHGGRRKKTRVVNLRRTQSCDGDNSSVSGESYTASSATSDTPATSLDVPQPEKISEEREDEVVTPPLSPSGRIKHRKELASSSTTNNSPKRPTLSNRKSDMGTQTSPEPVTILDSNVTPRARPSRPTLRTSPPSGLEFSSAKSQGLGLSSSNVTLRDPGPSVPALEAPTGGILERAWMLKVASEVTAHKAADDCQRQQGEKEFRANETAFWRRAYEEMPPPAYEAQ
ncbi:MAG: ERMES complex subunit [Piccolia ochrophora]|nr:MAG: ERMES complex subunit [Piccolia ochrophora]